MPPNRFIPKLRCGLDTKIILLLIVSPKSYASIIVMNKNLLAMHQRKLFSIVACYFVSFVDYKVIQ